MQKFVSIGIVILFIVSSTIPMVVGYETNTVTEELSPTLASDGLMDSAWPMICHDVRHTGRSPYSTASNPGTEKWRFKTDGWVDCAPVIDVDGVIYSGSLNFCFYSVSPEGTENWRSKVGGTIIRSSPSIVEDGTIYVGDWLGYLYAIDPDGSLKWMFGAGASIDSSPAIAEDGTIYFGTLWSLGAGGKIFAVNPNGTEKWRYQTGDAVSSNPAIGDDGTIYIGSMDGYLYAMNPNGTLRWRSKVGGEIHGHPSIADDGTIYIGSWDYFLYAFYHNGTLKWKFGTGSYIFGNPSIGEDDTIYIGSDKLYAIYPDGTLRWSFDLGEDRYISFSSPAISADGTIYIGTNIGSTDGGDIIAINPDGTERWRKLIANDWIYSTPSIAEDGTVYIGSSSKVMIDKGWAEDIGYIHAFGPVDSNEPPETPSITGVINGNKFREYYYEFSAIDPDNNPISFYVEWGDGTNTDWSGGGDGSLKMDECASGETVFIKHYYQKRGTFTIKAKARDGFGGESDWATLEVSMPKNKAITTPFFSILENHPRLFSILRYILEL